MQAVRNNPVQAIFDYVADRVFIGNNGIVDIIVLINELHAAIQNVQGATPSHAELATAYHAFQEIRMEKVVSECARSGQATRMASWQNGILKFVDTQVLSLHFLQRALINSGRKGLAQTPVLDFVPFKGENSGRVPWVAPTRRVTASA